MFLKVSKNKLVHLLYSLLSISTLSIIYLFIRIFYNANNKYANSFTNDYQNNLIPLIWIVFIVFIITSLLILIRLKLYPVNKIDYIIWIIFKPIYLTIHIISVLFITFLGSIYVFLVLAGISLVLLLTFLFNKLLKRSNKNTVNKVLVSILSLSIILIIISLIGSQFIIQRFGYYNHTDYILNFLPKLF